MGVWAKGEREGYTTWTGAVSGISICIMPELGSKAISLINPGTNREWLWQSGRPLGNKGYGSLFSEGDESGWDEMFPAINVCRYPDTPWQDRVIPDHGEVWAQIWQAYCEDGKLYCRTEGTAFPYSLEKVYSFTSENTIRIEYIVMNRSDYPFSFLWAAHPLFRAHAGMRLVVPDVLKEIEVSYSAGSRLGTFGDKHPWPIATSGGKQIDLGTIEPKDDQTAEKYYFTGKLDIGYASLIDQATGESVTLHFPAEQVPYLAVWANCGGYGGHYHVALEPATGRMDDLSYAMLNNETSVVKAQDTYRWYLDVTIT